MIGYIKLNRPKTDKKLDDFNGIIEMEHMIYHLNYFLKDITGFSTLCITLCYLLYLGKYIK
jgi:hypothetical protein